MEPVQKTDQAISVHVQQDIQEPTAKSRRVLPNLASTMELALKTDRAISARAQLDILEHKSCLWWDTWKLW